ncbi:MAG TPA: LamG domain-containing protein [Jatrophihabitans sp.]|nr:LamG domain-containing protein [Jatrophihabitans sp.]
MTKWSCALVGPVALVTALSVAGSPVAPAAAEAPAAQLTTAWSSTGGGNGHFAVDTADLVRSSDVVLDAQPAQGKQSMPLGNGSFGAAVWAQNGFTAQLNRVDTMPGRKSAGQLVIPGLAAMTTADDYHATLDLYDATLRQYGGGMTATTYVRADKDELVTDVTGADPSAAQTASVNLQAGRNPTPAVTQDGTIGVLSETWVDNQSASGGTGATFGSLAAVTAAGRDVTASTPDSRTTQVSFKPNTDGSFRVITAVPHWAGGDAATTAATLFGDDLTTPTQALAVPHLMWWHRFWAQADLVKLSSADQVADYIGNLRTIYLYIEAASERGAYPSSQAGVNDLFNFTRDNQQWGGDHYWLWNLRMDLAANISSGIPQFNRPFFEMYRRDLPTTEAWTRQQFPGTEGICLPETMRFDGTGWYLGTGTGNASCYPSETSYNAKTLTSGAELGSWIWREYRQTDDLAFLRTYYPLIAEPAKFLLTYAKVGDDGKLHTFPSNAHETQWDVHDPITDIAAMKMIFPIVMKAANTLGVDADLVQRVQAAIPQILDFPRTDAATHQQVKTAADDGDGNTVFAYSADPTAPYRNSENLDLEPVWPYDLVGDTSPLYDVAKLSYTARRNHNSNTWTYDPLQAARLDLRDQVAATLQLDAATHSQYANGLAAFSSSMTEPYDETVGVIATTVNEALATDYDGLLRIDPAMPASWNAEGTIAIAHRSSVHVQVENGQLATAVVESGSDHDITVRNPWPGQQVEVVLGNPSREVVVAPTSADTFTIHSDAGMSYIIQRPSAPLTDETFAPLTAAPATAPRHLPGAKSVIGIDAGTPTTPCPPPTQQLLLSWDPTSGSTITDASSYHRDGSFVNELPTYATDGPTGSAAVIGNGGYLSGAATTMGYLTSATFATEIKVTPGTGYRRIWDWKTSGGGDDAGFILDLNPSGQLRIITSGENHTLSTVLPTDTWEDVVVTVETDGTVNLYLNGTRVDGTMVSQTAIDGCATGDPHIGADQGGGQWISAEVDRSAVFSRALSASEVANWQSLAG